MQSSSQIVTNNKSTSRHNQRMATTKQETGCPSYCQTDSVKALKGNVIK